MGKDCKMKTQGIELLTRTRENADNVGSIHVLEKNGFICRERFVEDGRESVYYEKVLEITR